MLHKHKQQPEKPSLMGEDFDVFPDLNDRPNPVSAAHDPAPEEEEDDPGPTDFQIKVAAISEEKWKIYQVLAGVFLGLLCGGCLTIGGQLLSGSTSAILAFGIALIIPGILEKQSARKIPRLRITMCIALFVWLAGYYAYAYFTDPTFLKAG